MAAYVLTDKDFARVAIPGTGPCDAAVLACVSPPATSVTGCICAGAAVGGCVAVVGAGSIVVFAASVRLAPAGVSACVAVVA